MAFARIRKRISALADCIPLHSSPAPARVHSPALHLSHFRESRSPELRLGDVGRAARNGGTVFIGAVHLISSQHRSGVHWLSEAAPSVSPYAFHFEHSLASARRFDFIPLLRERRAASVISMLRAARSLHTCNLANARRNE